MSEDTSNHSFDELAKGLATGTLSRGKAIRLVGGALLGAALGSFPGVAWADDCRRLGRECRRDSQCCSKNCVRRGDDKVCGCPEGKSRCGLRCVNLETNEDHCGECFNRCDEGQECVDSVCAGGCVPDGGACSGDTNCCTRICNSNICGSCRPIGGTCSGDLQCCPDSFNCSSGTCAPCVAVGGSCTSDFQCCADESTNFNRICGIPAGQSNGTCVTCRASGSPCGGDLGGPCCNGFCNPDDTCP